ncbi:LysR family transcriptional regulator [Bradyrhizobium sp. CCBAU 45389]|uniref:LysR family transcriptional regulator n=1 Tax=Bradyrhizobium sp. CCBAU 45389 TaxID=858429 RepID=UPI002306299A|nr:LysR family transcriptional regulator [Bradyrhizobium sp. CCBAU 45389]MDA9401603.1 LysR family transcriptional regulator [Bradyrhizobium sp. CCBAU 45389]
MRHLKIHRYIAEVARRSSIRGAAEHLNITPSALTRQIQDFEDELGTPIFERLPQGMRLNSAGELLIRHIRDQRADFERLRSQIADLSGVRLGHVSVACSQAFIDNVLPDEIAAYRAQFPKVTFSLVVRDHILGATALSTFEVDLALLLNPPPVPDMRILFSTDQPLCAVFRADHPLARPGSVRLRDCFAFPTAMPDQTLAIRHLLDVATSRRQIVPNIQVESGSLEFLRNYVMREQAVTFHALSAVPREDRRIYARPIDTRDVTPIQIVLGQLRGRVLSVAAAKFADQLSIHLARHDPIAE